MRESYDALVLRASPYGESDRMLTVLTAERGRIRVCAKHASSQRSTVRWLCTPGIFGNLELEKKGEVYFLRGGCSQESFVGLHRDLSRYALACYLLELCLELSDEGVEAGDLLRRALNALYLLEKGEKDPEIIKAAFEFASMAEAGFLPDLSACSVCGREDFSPTKDYDGGLYLNVNGGCLVCSSCRRQADRAGISARQAAENEICLTPLLPVSPPVLAALRYVAGAEPARLYSFQLPDERDRKDLSHLTEIYARDHLDHAFETLTFYRSVQ